MNKSKTERIREQQERKLRFKFALAKIRASIEEQTLPDGFQTELDAATSKAIDKIERELLIFTKREEIIAEWEEIKKRMRFAHIKVSPLFDYSSANTLAKIKPKQAKQLGPQYLGECVAIIAVDRLVNIGKIKPKTSLTGHLSVYAREEFVENLADGLKERFEHKREEDLKQLLKGIEPRIPLIFRGFGSTLIFTLKRAYESNWFSCPNKNDFIEWICKSFEYASGKKNPRSFSKGQVSKIIYSTEYSIPRSRKIEIEGLIDLKNKR
jgi:hypothetical protein